MEYTKEKLHNLVETQRDYFKTNETLDVNFRITQLKKLKEAVTFYEDEICEALYKELGRSKTESYLLDIGPTILEINEIIRGLKWWAKPELHFSGIMCFPSIFTRVYKMPYGVTLIISPSNFPFLLTLGVLAASISGGNTAIVKPSSKSKACSKVISKIIKRAFDSKYITVVEGGHDVNDLLLDERFDKIFYTGSPKVGKHILEKASKNLTPVALELGGETGNWAIVRKDADLKDAARKIAFFKICNAGRICINVNQVAIAKEVADKFIEYLKDEFKRQIGDKPLDNPEYGKTIDVGTYQKVIDEINMYQDRIVFGGKGNKTKLKVEPTILYPIDINEEVVNHELFCPILPIVEYDDEKIDELINVIENREHGLALYLFTSDKKWAKKIMTSSQYGGGCVNEVCMHLMVKGAPFNGTGHSGMGAYHGVWGFREFSHPSTVLYGSNKFNLSLREHPYTNIKNKIIRMFEK